MIQKHLLEVFYEKRCSWKFRKIHRKTPVPESKKTFFCEFEEISKNNFFTENLLTTTSNDQRTEPSRASYIINLLLKLKLLIETYYVQLLK